jgi:hypothetical protein
MNRPRREAHLRLCDVDATASRMKTGSASLGFRRQPERASAKTFGRAHAALLTHTGPCISSVSVLARGDMPS